MTPPSQLRRKPVAIALAFALLCSPFLWQTASGDERPSRVAPRGIVVVGDSITANYNDKSGDKRQGWWSIVGHRYGAKVRTYAQRGSGYLRPGLGCKGDRFVDRGRVFIDKPPSFLIVEGGRNDWATCEHGHLAVAPDSVVRQAVDRYLETLKSYLPRSTRIIVIGPPWGPLDPENGARVTRIVESAAKRHGLQFVSMTGALTRDRVVDGVHPNHAGSQAIAARVIKALG